MKHCVLLLNSSVVFVAFIAIEVYTLYTFISGSTALHDTL